MTNGRIAHIESIAIELKEAGITSISKAYIENTGICPSDGRFKFEFKNLNEKELAFLEKSFHSL